jgi:hypothetical protein
MAEERRLDVSLLSERQRLLPLVVSKVYEFMIKEADDSEKQFGYRVEEFTKFRQHLFDQESRPCSTVPQLLVANFLIKNQNTPLSCTSIRDRMKLPDFSPDLRYIFYKDGTELVQKEVLRSTKTYNLTEAIEYYPNLEDWSRSQSTYSQVFLGNESSLSALSKMSKRYGPKKIVELMKMYIINRADASSKLMYPKFRERLLGDAFIEAQSWAYKHTKH